MRTFQWSHELKIGHPRIDEEHQLLLGLIGDVEERLEGVGAVPADAAEIYQRFLIFLRSHCDFEEQLMRDLPSRYVQRVSSHCRNHGQLMHEARALLPLLTAQTSKAEVLEYFRRAIISLTRDLIMDDSELVGILLREHHLVLMPDGGGESELRLS